MGGQTVNKRQPLFHIQSRINASNEPNRPQTCNVVLLTNLIMADET